ncbi:hypothetical protein [Dyadobacter tibetensis]|uniref:hypothetical protein n=1 Tax=Dyadobacter tibetensis TaxID=1211851 RepID=UPI00103CEA7C|nr:hypothetical protein [Dyadobacter tibetensis]
MNISMRLNLLILFSLTTLVLYGQDISEQKFNQEIVTQYTSTDGSILGSIHRIIMDKGRPIAFSESQAYVFKNGTWTKDFSGLTMATQQAIDGNKSEKVLSSVVYGKQLVVGTETGLYFQTNGKRRPIYPADTNYSWAPRQVSALTVDSFGDLWFGSQDGIGKLSKGVWTLFTGKQGLPYNQFTCAASGADGSVWFGTQKGVIVVRNNHFSYKSSRRWLPDDRVQDIVVDPNGNAFIATAGGIAQISPTPMTLEEKAHYFTNQVETRHNRMGFIAHSELTKQFDLTTSRLAISDNDGKYTAMYGAAQAFRYAVTGDPVAKELADRSFKACKWLSDITPEPGFPARVIIPTDWHEPVNEQYSREFNKKRQETDPQWKDIYPRFPLSKDGKYRYKCDTSSDELAGHFFFYGIYYDLVAKTVEEKMEVKAVVADMMDHLLRHGYKLVDYDGKVTRWGDFSPEYFHSVYGYDQRGLNSMMMLSFLNVAKHVTGNAKYEQESALLRNKHNYHIFALHPKEYFPSGNVVPWDNNLCLMSMYGLLRYESDPALILMYRQALETAWLHMSKQKNSFWDTIYEALAKNFGKQVDEKLFVRTDLFPENHLYAPSVVREHYKPRNHTPFILENLQKMPLDLIGYSMPNTHRLDIIKDPTPGTDSEKGWGHDGYALPLDERGHVRQDRDSFDLNLSEGDGWSEHEGTFYLLPYYMARYHHLLR